MSDFERDREIVAKPESQNATCSAFILESTDGKAMCRVIDFLGSIKFQEGSTTLRLMERGETVESILKRLDRIAEQDAEIARLRTLLGRVMEDWLSQPPIQFDHGVTITQGSAWEESHGQLFLDVRNTLASAATET
jgi:hypothetical protein